MNDLARTFDLTSGQSADLTSGQSAHYLLPDLRCAGCALKVEKALDEFPGVRGVNVNYAEKRLSFTAESDAAAGSVIERLQELGYPATPDRANEGLMLLARERKGLLARLGVAGIGMMQVMMFALADYVSGAQGIEADYESLMRWAALVIATPVVFYSALPFHRGAWRDIRQLSPGMDVPVSLAILSAFSLSVFHTLTGSGEVYFDSACMFTFFLLTGRFLEVSARRNFHVEETLGDHLLPELARLASGEWKSLDDVCAGDELRISAGEAVPADGIVSEGTASADESAFTGESEPVNKKVGSRLLAGSTLLEGTVIIRVEADRTEWVISHLSDLYRQSSAFKPRFAILADLIARYFVMIVLGLATASGLFWYLAGNPDFFVIALSVLVVSCPCALSLATPVAYTMASGAVRKLGLLINNGKFLERLATADTVVFDKTGTLTTGRLTLDEVQLLDNSISETEVMKLAASLESGSQHPVALAIMALAAGSFEVRDRSVVPGFGVEGKIDGKRYRLGKPEFAASNGEQRPDADRNWVLLSCEGESIAWMAFGDQLREGAGEAVRIFTEQLIRRGGNVFVFTGDNSARGVRMMGELGLTPRTNMTPEMKITGVRELQSAGHRVLMVGDGLNDTGALAVADLSLALNPVDTVVQSAADATLVSSDLGSLPVIFGYASKVSGVIRQNLFWALTYNLSVIPLALMGFVPPWVAALGMSMSSLLVTINACRLARTR